ncbi:unnamed protein product [Pieris macdunnoughi]|uniref:Multiple inositol polyphosphate phosphatase 1 n=1 Tax=Pieris macdunnoughi TaxID=345717 RepID=A0A821UY29_9NEOP|nr:unnamed protein product [Pieris macdunnoughi]
MQLIFVNLFLSCISSVIGNFCYWNTGCPYKYLSSETPYNLVRGDIRDSVVKLNGCEPVSVWGIFRHGKRYPEATTGKTMQEAVSLRQDIISSYQRGHSSLCAQDIENLHNWQYDPTIFEDKQDITEEGRKEMLFLGKRFREAFPKIMNDLHDANFRSAKGMWLENSIKEFVKGLGNPNLVIDPPKTAFDDIAPYLSCEKSLDSNPKMYTEIEKYLNTSDYLVVKDRIQRRTGKEKLTIDNVSALYNLCRYTWSGIDSTTSPWCALFTKDDLQVLEYEEDLKHYYENGYGLSINEIFGGMPLADLWRNFDRVRSGEGKKLVAYVTHAKTLDQIYTALGLFNDTNPKAARRDADRKWRSSIMSGYSANLVAVLNKCTNEVDDYNIVFYMNEEPIRSICADGVCSWLEFEHKFRSFVNTNFDFCQFLN